MMRPRAPRVAWATSKRGTRQQRGYGRQHELMREQVLREEPLCRICIAAGHVTATAVADHIKPKAEGGSDDRSNYQGLCNQCHRAKTAAERARARGFRPPGGGGSGSGGSRA